MYGSIHSHFEDNYDAMTDMTTALLNYHKAGCKKVAATGHGIFSQFEDLKDIEKNLKKKDPTFDLEVIPGIEGYFGDDAAHIILVAKDYEGYVSLSHIISESALNVDSKDRPIITMENLKKNVDKGHILCTSACIAGVFGRDMGLTVANLEEKIKKAEKKIGPEFPELKRNFIIYSDAKSIRRPLKKELAAAEKEFKKTGNRTLLDEWEMQAAIYENAQKTLETLPDDIDAQIKKYNQYAKYEKEIGEYQKQIEE